MTITGIISAILIGIVVGLIGRLIVPGRQPIGILVTILVGIVSAFIGSAIARALGIPTMTNGIDWLELLVQVIVAAIGVALVSAMMGRRKTGLLGGRRFRPAPLTSSPQGKRSRPLSAAGTVALGTVSFSERPAACRGVRTLDHPALHARGQQGITSFGVGADRASAQLTATIAQIVEPQVLDVDHVWGAFEFEGLDDELIRAYHVIDAVESVATGRVRVLIAIAAAGTEIPVLDPHFQSVRPQPPGDQLGLGVGAEQRIHRCVERAGELHCQGVDRCSEIERVRHSGFSSGLSVGFGAIPASRSSSLR